MSTTPEPEKKPVLKTASTATLPVVQKDEEKPEDSSSTSGSEKAKSEKTVVKEVEVKDGTKEEGAKKDEGKEGTKGGTIEGAPGLLVTKDLLNVIADCRSKVESIAKECRANNTKFRDVEWDLLNETYMCLYSIDWSGINKWPSDRQRVTEVFENPMFFKADGAPSSDDIVQGALGDCWFLCALATISNLPHLVKEICVARDEEVGVYGFIFYRDNGWVSVIIDDVLCTNSPKWEELSQEERDLYEDKDQFNMLSRKGGKTLTFAKSGAKGETWVPLIEKAYAKFYGTYNHIQGGYPREAIEDLTGGVATLIMTTDILDRDTFWKEQLLKANKDRLFSCYFPGLNDWRSGESNARVQGLVGNHAYSVLRAMECNGKRFVVVRNPWGESEWTGRWGDGSKEWKGEWLKILPELGHRFGDDGQFVMEYDDFLACFTHIDRTLLFDSTWTASSKWLQVPVPLGPTPWSYGDISFDVTIPSKTKTVFVLSQLNSRFFRNLEGYVYYNLDFSIGKAGEKKTFARSTQAMPYCRRVTAELELDPGKYYVYVRIDKSEFVMPGWTDEETLDDIYKDPILARRELFNTRQLSKALNDKIKSQKVASNYPKKQFKFEPTTLESAMERRNAPKSFMGKIFGPTFTKRTKRQVNPSDYYEGLLQKDEVVVGLSVYTDAKAPAKVVGRLKDGIKL